MFWIKTSQRLVYYLVSWHCFDFRFSISILFGYTPLFKVILRDFHFISLLFFDWSAVFLLVFFPHPIHFLRTYMHLLLSLLPTRNSDPGSHSRLFSPLPAWKESCGVVWWREPTLLVSYCLTPRGWAYSWRTQGGDGGSLGSKVPGGLAERTPGYIYYANTNLKLLPLPGGCFGLWPACYFPLSFSLGYLSYSLTRCSVYK